MKRFHTGIGIPVVIALAMLAGCTSNVRDAAPEDRAAAVEQERDSVRSMAQDTLQALYSREPSARSVVDGAAGYAVFSNFGMKLLVTGGGTGKGLAFNNATREEVFMRMAELQAGLGFGVKKFRLVWVFQAQDAFDDFVDSGYQLGGHASLSAQSGDVGGGLAGAVSVSPGVWIYQITDDGIAAEVTVKGTRYYRDKDLD